MADAGYYRGEARRCRSLAASSPDSSAAVRWLQLAKEYDELADAIDGHAALHPPSMSVPMQQQPIQQQQSKTEPQDDT